MAVIKDIVEQEQQRVSSGVRRELHLWSEGTFLRAYGWSAWLACRFLHDFKVNKRQFKGVESPVVFIGFPASSLPKWIPEGAEQEAVGEKHLVLRLPEQMLAATLETIDQDYVQWCDAIPLTTAKDRSRQGTSSTTESSECVSLKGDVATLTGIMQRILAFPIESKSPMESMQFIADVKQRLAALI